MKSFLKALAVLTAVVVVAGCDTGSGDTTVTPFDPSSMSVYVHVQPTVDNGSTMAAVPFEGWVQINTEENLSAATVTINGKKLAESDWMDNYFGPLSVGSLKAGDAVTVTISHPRITTIEANATVPDSIDDFTTSPTLPAKGIANTNRTYTVDWTTISGATGYYLSAYHYESSGGSMISGYGNDYTSPTVNLNFPYGTNEIYKWIAIEVNSLNYVDFTDEYGLRYGELYVHGTKNVRKAN